MFLEGPIISIEAIPCRLISLMMAAFYLAPAVSGQCQATVKFRVTDLDGSPLRPAVQNDPSYADVTPLNGAQRTKTRVSIWEPLRTKCGWYTIQAHVAGGRTQTLTVELREGDQPVSFGIPPGWMHERQFRPARGSWPGALSECPQAFVRAVSLYGQDSPSHGSFLNGRDFVFHDIDPGRYVLVLVSMTGECKVPPAIVWIKGGNVIFPLE